MHVNCFCDIFTFIIEKEVMAYAIGFIKGANSLIVFSFNETQSFKFSEVLRQWPRFHAKLKVCVFLIYFLNTIRTFFFFNRNSHLNLL